MGYVALVGAIVGAGISIYQGVSGSRVARRNAQATQDMANYNASMAMWEARENSNRVLATSAFNAMLNIGMSSTRAALAFSDAKYNADLNWYIGNYNSRLLEREEKYLWQEHDLAKYLYSKSLDKTTSEITATYAASGIEIGNAGEAPEEAKIDHKSQGALQLFIMQHSAEVKAKKLLEAAARGRVSAAMESNNIMYQGMANGLGDINRAQINAIGSMAQGIFDSKHIITQGRFRANSLLAGGSFTASQYNRRAQQVFMSGMLNAGGQVAQGVSGYVASSYSPKEEPMVENTFNPEPTSYQLGETFSFENKAYDAQLGNPMLWDNN